MIRPSPAVHVRADTPISECIRIMNERGVDSLLVNSTSLPHDLIGIFTERDVVRCSADIQKRGAWEKSVALVMTRTPQTISLYELDRAVEVMARLRFRHLPVTYEDEGGKLHVAGIISMRDLFQAFAAGRIASAGAAPVRAGGPLRIGYLAADVARQKSLSLILNQAKALVGVGDYVSRPVLPAAPDEMAEELRRASFTHLVADIDGLPPAQWIALIKFMTEEQGPRGFVLFDPARYAAKDLEFIEGLAASRVRFFPKPLDLLGLLSQIGLSEA